MVTSVGVESFASSLIGENNAGNLAVAGLEDFGNALVAEIERDATDLIRWLYENQGGRRFDASNRLFWCLLSKGTRGNSSGRSPSWKRRFAATRMVAETIWTGELNSTGKASGIQLFQTIVVRCS